MNHQLLIPRRRSGDWVASLLAHSPLALYAADRGLYKAVAASFAAASLESLSVASNATLQCGTGEYWIACWFKTTWDAQYRGLLSKSGFGAMDAEFYIRSSGVGAQLECYMGDGLGGFATLAAPYTDGAWNFVMLWVDTAANKFRMRVNGGAVTESTITITRASNSQPLCIGNNNGAVADYCWNGQIDSVMFGKAPAAGMSALATTLYDRLYASGAGLNYADLTAAEKIAWGLVSAWDLDEISGTRNDSHGTNHLTDNNTVTSAAGKPNKLATAASDPIGLWLDQSGNARHLSAAALANQPTLALAYQNGKPAVLFDGVDDYMLASAFQSFPSKRGVLVVVEKTTLAVGTCQLCGTYSAAVVDWLAYVTKSGTKYNWYDGVSDLVSATFDGAATELEVWSRDGDTSISHRRNAALADALTCANNQPSSDVLAVGASTTGGTPYKGGIMTIALFGDKTLAEVQAIESILNSAWAVY